MKHARLIQRVLGGSSLLRKIDRAIRNGYSGDLLPPIFIIGAPRSGSTVIYQAIVAKYEVAFLSNIHSLFYAEPCLAEKLVSFLKKTGVAYKPSFTSNYGFVNGVMAPSEAGPTFRYWFGEADYMPPDREADHDGIKKSLAVLTRSGSIPFVAKNLFNSMRIKEIIKCFPDAFFVWVRRDRARVVHSILKMRQDVGGDINNWMSVKVPQWQKIASLAPEKQVRRQVEGIEEYINNILSCRNDSLHVQVSFEKFCARPEHVVDYIMARYMEIADRTVSVRSSFTREQFQQIKKVT